MAFERSTAAGATPARGARATSGSFGAESKVHQRAPEETQAFNPLVHVPIGLSETVCVESVAALNQVLASTMTLRDRYRKHHWQTSGATFYQLHLLSRDQLGDSRGRHRSSAAR